MTVFLTLGDGDFSYSLDLVRYLTKKSTTANHVVVTGIDSLNDMQTKYKDCDFLLRQLRSAQHDKLTIDIRHEIDAVSSHDTTLIQADVVIFNHPHLGIEDASRHARFLHHFLSECNKSWLATAGGGGTVQLTLAVGQWERWKGHQAASRQGFVLKHRLAFFAPPVEDAKYQNRRHQTGKSFNKRTTGSETFVLGRSNEETPYLFTWQIGVDEVETPVDTPMFACPSCERSFREERSLKNHMKVVHDDGRKRKRPDGLKCQHCDSLGILKVFPNAQGLSDHVQAKHAGIHTATIRPDWAKSDVPLIHPDSGHGSCDICDYVYRDAGDALRHAQEFRPALVSLAEQSFPCQFCKKTFHDRRAQLQHENFCKPHHESGSHPGPTKTSQPQCTS
jgi:hypothetical protein